VEHFNKDILLKNPTSVPDIEYHKKHYFGKLSKAYMKFNSLVENLNFPKKNFNHRKIIIDCSNGVGGL
jgi:hypothetical protein